MLHPHPRSHLGEVSAIPVPASAQAERLAAETAWRRHWIFLAGGFLLTVGWLALCGYYLQTHVGWNNLFALLPHEFAGFGVGALGPPLVLLALAIYFRRGQELSHTAEALRGLGRSGATWCRCSCTKESSTRLAPLHWVQCWAWWPAYCWY